MYLHIGQDFILESRNIIGVFDLDNTTAAGKITRNFLQKAEKEGVVIPVADGLPKSFIVTNFPTEAVYLTQLSTATIKARAAHFATGEKF